MLSTLIDHLQKLLVILKKRTNAQNLRSTETIMLDGTMV